MRIAVACLLLLTVPMVLGQVRVEVADPAGDVSIGDASGLLPAPTGFDHLDLLHAWIGQETETSVSVGLTVQGGIGMVGQANGLPLTTIAFGYGGVSYEVVHGACASMQEVAFRGGPNAACIPAEADANGWQATLDKSWIIDLDGFPLHVGSQLSGWYAASNQRVSGPYRAMDRAPNQSEGNPFTMTLGTNQVGDIVVERPSIVRASNGGADTFLYVLRVLNDGPEAAVRLTAQGIPEAWSVRYPPSIRLPATAVTDVPVVVATKFAHSHGGTERFTLHLETLQGTLPVEIGIHYLDVPQVTGHHSTLYLHGGETPPEPTLPLNYVDGWMNTLPDDPAEGARWLPSHGGGFAIGGTSYQVQGTASWTFPLDPALLVGMDFDLAKVGILHAELRTDVPADQAFMEARLWHCNANSKEGPGPGVSYPCNGSWFLLAEGTSGTQRLTSGGVSAFEVELPPTPYADIVLHAAGNNVALEIDLIYSTLQPADTLLPELDTQESFMSLPLLEFRDPIDAAFEDLGSLRIISTSAVHKQLNAGQTAWFTFDVMNDGRSSRTLELDFLGNHGEWASALPATPFTLSPGSAARVALQVDVPLDVPAGERLQGYFIVQDAHDDLAAAMGRVVADVISQPVPAETRPDGLASQSKESPAPAFAVLLVLAAVAAHRRRLAPR